MSDRLNSHGDPALGMTEEAAKKLREQFPAHQIGKLPKAGIQLDYVGHAAVTDRLLDVDPEWSWEPVAFANTGAPLIEYGAKEASMWIRLTICGVTRLGVGIVLVSAFELEKQLISDALRNAAMRFGVALDLWSKQDLHDVANAPAPDAPPAGNPSDFDLSTIETMKVKDLLQACGAYGVKQGGTAEEMRARLREIAGTEGRGSGGTILTGESVHDDEELVGPSHLSSPSVPRGDE